MDLNFTTFYNQEYVEVLLVIVVGRNTPYAESNKLTIFKIHWIINEKNTLVFINLICLNLCRLYLILSYRGNIYGNIGVFLAYM